MPGHSSHGNHGNHSSHSSHGSHGSHSSHTSHGSHQNTGSNVNTGSHASHGNHANSGNPTDTGAPVSLTWNNWPTNTIAEGSEIGSTDSTNKIKELREKIDWLQQNKGPYTKSIYPTSPYFIPDNPAVDLSGADDSNLEAHDKIDDAQYDALKNSLETLKTFITGSGTGLPDKNAGHVVHNEDIQNLKSETDGLAAYDASGAHANHHNTGAHASHGNHSNHSNHANHTSHYNKG